MEGSACLRSARAAQQDPLSKRSFAVTDASELAMRAQVRAWLVQEDWKRLPERRQRN